MSLTDKYGKLYGPLLGSVAMAIVLAYRSAVADAVIGADEWVLGITQVLMVVSVWGAANVRGWSKGKTLQAALFAVLALLAATITNGLTGDEITQLIITGLSALGVATMPQVVGLMKGGRVLNPSARPSTPAPPQSSY